jgi:transcriptional regulator with XRE-family HTH domain
MRAAVLFVTFGTVLRKERAKVGLSQEALALAADVDRTFVSQIERGLRQPSLMTIWKLAGALEVSPSALIERTERLLK